MEPRKAFNYLNSLAEGEIKSQAMTEVAKIVARTDPEYLASAAESMPANRAHREVVQELTKAYGPRFTPDKGWDSLRTVS